MKSSLYFDDIQSVAKKYLKEAILKKVNADQVFANATKKAYKEFATKGQKNLAVSAKKQVLKASANRRIVSAPYAVVKTAESAVSTTMSDVIKDNSKNLIKSTPPPKFSAPAPREREVGIIKSPTF